MELIGTAAACLTVYVGFMFSHGAYDTSEQVNDHIIRHINDRQDISTLKARLSYMRPGVRLNASRILECLSSKLSSNDARYCLDVLVVLRDRCPTPHLFHPTELLKTAITESVKTSDIKELLEALLGHGIDFVLNATPTELFNFKAVKQQCELLKCLTSKLSSSNASYCLDVLDVLRKYCSTPDHFNPTEFLKTAITESIKTSDIKALLDALPGHSIDFVLNATQIWDCLSSKLSRSNARYCLDVLDVLREYCITPDHFNPTELLMTAIAESVEPSDIKELLAAVPGPNIDVILNATPILECISSMLSRSNARYCLKVLDVFRGYCPTPDLFNPTELLKTAIAESVKPSCIDALLAAGNSTDVLSNGAPILEYLTSKLSSSNARYCLDLLDVFGTRYPHSDLFNPTALLKEAIAKKVKPSDIKALLAALPTLRIDVILDVTQILECTSSMLSSSNAGYCVTVLIVFREYCPHFNPTVLLEAAIAKRDKLEALLIFEALLEALPDGSMDPTSMIAFVLKQDNHFDYHCGVLSRCITSHTKWNIKLDEIKIKVEIKTKDEIKIRDEMLVHAIILGKYVTHFKLFRDLHAAGYDFNTKSSVNKDVKKAYFNRTKTREMKLQIPDWDDNRDLIGKWIKEAKKEAKERENTSKKAATNTAAGARRKRSDSKNSSSSSSKKRKSKKRKTESLTVNVTPNSASVHIEFRSM